MKSTPARCVLAASMDGALAAVRALARALAASGKPLDILVTATASGLDVDLKGHGPLGEAETQTLVRLALAHDLARLSNRGSIMISRRTPMLAMGKAIVAPPPGVFLQATETAEETLAAKVCAHVAGARRIADLFSGVGTRPLQWNRSSGSNVLTVLGNMKDLLRAGRFRMPGDA